MNLFNLTNMRLSKRLTVGFGALMLLVLFIAGLSVWGLNALKMASDAALEQSDKKIKLVEIQRALDKIRSSIVEIASSTSQTDKDKFKEELEAWRKFYRERLDALKAHSHTAAGKELLTKVEEAIEVQKAANNKAIDLGMKWQEADVHALFAGEIAETTKKIDKALADFNSHSDLRQKELQQGLQDTTGQVRLTLIIVVGTGLIFAIIFAMMINGSISKPLGISVGFLNDISKGNLMRDVPAELRGRKDEVGELTRALQTMTENLRRLISEVTTGVETMASASTELSAVSAQTAQNVKDMGQRATTVAAAAEESSVNTVSVAASMEQASTNLSSVAGATEEMSATVTEIASNSEKARAIAEQASTQAHHRSRPGRGCRQGFCCRGQRNQRVGPPDGLGHRRH